MSTIVPKCIGDMPHFQDEHDKWVDWQNKREAIVRQYAMVIRPNIILGLYDFRITCTSKPNAPECYYGRGQGYDLAEVIVKASIEMNNAIRNHTE